MNRGVAKIPGQGTNWIDLLRHRAVTQPERIAYRFLIDGESQEVTRTYREIDREARAIAALLQGLGAAGARVMLLLPPGIEFIAAFFGCLYAGAAAVPVASPRSTKHAPAMARLRAVAGDAQPQIALTLTRQRAAMAACLAEALGGGALPCIPTDDLASNLSEQWREPGVAADAVACIQYTSGATAEPRGVVLTHRNLLHNSGLIAEAFGHTAESRGVIWLPPYHDMGLVGGVLQPLFAGFPVTLMPPGAFLQKPGRWLRAIARDRATTSGGPNFAYDLCAARISEAERASLDLSSWDLAFTGAEPVRAQTLSRFADTFAASGFRREAFYPCYGLAEATLMVAGGEKSAPPVVKKVSGAALAASRLAPASGDADAKALVGCGRVRGEQSIVIVDPEILHRCAGDRVGEIWVSGPSVAQGYWGNAAETEGTFGAQIVGEGETRFLRTGDLGFMDGKELFVTGRLKDLIIIRGVHYYPQDIELTAQESHPALQAGGAAAFSIEMDGQEIVVVVQEMDRTQRDADPAAVISAVRSGVSARHELPLHAVVLLKPGRLPRTPSGKVRRAACRDAFLAGTLEAVASWRLADDRESLAGDATDAAASSKPVLPGPATVSDTERWLAEKFAAALKLDSQSLDLTEPFARYGLDSLAAVEVALQISGELDEELPPALFWDYPNIAALARYLVEERGVRNLPNSS